MKAISATPRDIRRIFADSYVIPDFQRPYTWEKENCYTLWEDIVDFHNHSDDDDEKYFLGNIVVHPISGGKFSVIDGQQRLTTLLLLIKALHTKAGTYSALQGCYRISDKRNDSLTDELRVKSEVVASDSENLRKIIFNDIESADNCKLVANYNSFLEMINEWLRLNGSDSNAFHSLIDTLLDKIVLLPIECNSEDDALTIFQTINNTGISLSDADIFKAKLYKSAPEDKRSTFIEDWNSLKNHDWLFRVYMHIVRANTGEIGKEKRLRSFFTDRKESRLFDWEKVVASLKKIYCAYYDVWLEENYGIINSLWAILETYPNQYWNYPIYVFLHKYGIYGENTGFMLSEEHRAKMEELFEESVKYFFTKGLVDNSVNTVKDVTFRVCAKINSGDDYISEFKSGVTTNDKTHMLQKLDNSMLGRYREGIILLSAYLNPEQDRESFADMLWTDYHIEHILPRNWNHYDGWTQESYDDHINTLGNLIPLERKLNIKAQNEYLSKKKKYYADSVVQDALDMLNIPDNGWIPSSVENMQKVKVQRLIEFFGLK